MRYVWDPAKAAANLGKHGVGFAAVHGFDWQTAVTEADRRRDYGEPRFRSAGMIGRELFILVHTPRGEAVRVISLRRANRREIMRYAATDQAG